MRCKHCVAHAVDRKESFIVGCAVLKLDNIKKHEQTQSHIQSSEIAFAILAPDKTAGQQLRRQLTAAQALKMSTMFPTSHALVLAKHFKPVVQSRLEVGKLNDEWTSLKADVYSGRDWEKTLSTLDWSEINRLYPSYSNLLSLMDLALTLPVSKAECERGFSWLKRTKTDVLLSTPNPSTSSCVLLWNHQSLQSLIPHIQSNFGATKPSPDGASGMLREPGAGVHSHKQAQKKLKSQQPLKAWSKRALQHMMKKRNFSFG